MGMRWVTPILAFFHMFEVMKSLIGRSDTELVPVMVHCRLIFSYHFRPSDSLRLKG